MNVSFSTKQHSTKFDANHNNGDSFLVSNHIFKFIIFEILQPVSHLSTVFCNIGSYFVVRCIVVDVNPFIVIGVDKKTIIKHESFICMKALSMASIHQKEDLSDSEESNKNVIACRPQKQMIIDGTEKATHLC